MEYLTHSGLSQPQVWLRRVRVISAVSSETGTDLTGEGMTTIQLYIYNHTSRCAWLIWCPKSQNIFVANSAPASCGSCTCLLLSPWWFMWWERPVQLELKYGGPNLGSLLEEFVFKRASLSACMVFTAQRWIMHLPLPTPTLWMFGFGPQAHAPFTSLPIPILNRVKFNHSYSCCYFGEEKESFCLCVLQKTWKSQRSPGFLLPMP